MDKMVAATRRPQAEEQCENPAADTLFAVARQIITRLCKAGETLETLSGRVNATSQCDDAGGKDCCSESLMGLLEEANRRAHDVARGVNDLASKVGE